MKWNLGFPISVYFFSILYRPARAATYNNNTFLVLKVLLYERPKPNQYYFIEQLRLYV